MTTQIRELHIAEETLNMLERNGGFQWHEQGDCRLLKDILQHKPKSLLDRLREWLRGDQ